MFFVSNTLIYQALIAAAFVSVGFAQATKPEIEKYALIPAFPAQAKFDRPLCIDHHQGDPAVYYVIEQYGRIYRIPRDGEQGGRELFLDWRSQTLSPRSGGHNEEGLLGFAFAPKFDENGFVYLYYSRKTGQKTLRRRGKEFQVPTRESVLSRFATVLHGKQRIAVVDSELPILRVPQPYGNHNGGTIAFGPDQMLYVALGDGGAANDPLKAGQDLSNLLGSILRLDVRNATNSSPYKVPADNPFVGRDQARGEIWAYGVRNPWRISFDRATGELWCADVGQNLWEEVNRVVQGGNYGWNKREALHAFSSKKKPLTDAEKSASRAGADQAGMLDPVAEYHHREGVSVTGGYVYRGTDLPELRGQYLYADYQTGRLWSVAEDRTAGKHRVTALMRRAGAVASFGETDAGEILILRYDGDLISRLVRAPTK